MSFSLVSNFQGCLNNIREEIQDIGFLSSDRLGKTTYYQNSKKREKMSMSKTRGPRIAIKCKEEP